MALRTFDDTDPAVQYVGVWRTAGNAQEEYNGTTTVTNVPGSTARVTFTGTGISVFGTVEMSSRPVSNYSIEGNPSTEAQFIGEGSNNIQYGVKFYEVKDLDPAGRHVLIIVNEQSNAQLYLDYFSVAGESIPPISSVTGSSSTSSATSASSSSAAPSSSSPPIGPIIGGALGGVALICLAALGFVFYKRRGRRERHREHHIHPSQVSGPPPITPFVTAPSQGLSYTSRAGSGSIASSSQPPTFAPFQHHEKQLSIPADSSPHLPPSPDAGKVLDPPPRYEG